jgi:hypothetical protein
MVTDYVFEDGMNNRLNVEQSFLETEVSNGKMHFSSLYGTQGSCEPKAELLCFSPQPPMEPG